ncbi:carboxypeptidase-like regulatory domain-containing protein [Roseimaritima ulvae]|uniref:Carboxypeptidase regulatory-like domain-containing protein n=1 Tax=Roseimaritima ulvae TaxID=980254 RepID=A0A5B9QVN5_9BACT|nr:carboxypeptidase-like regulatory domain-containing protein [Roseimaritima ulvae]QEG38081.1 hypothetical protein UC8_00340 [Roseimaritima ulvae]
MKYHYLLLLSTLMCLGGCSGKSDRWTQARPPVYPVSGQVLLNDQPVEHATITFQPSDPAGKAGSAITDAEGRFEAQTFDPGDGLTAGTHKVAIKKIAMVDASGNIVEEIREPGGITEKHFLPKKYGDYETSELEITVNADGSNELTPFELKE